MRSAEIDRFFRELAREFTNPCTVILTGAGAGAIYGRVRATMDLDFALEFTAPRRRSPDNLWEAFEAGVSRVSAKTGIAAQYAEDIDRRSSITYLDYQRHTLAYKTFGSIEVRLMEPVYWAIGKMTRFLDPDIEDMIRVFKKNRVAQEEIAEVMGRALRESPRSTACDLFRRQVELFFRNFGRRVWGKAFDPENAILLFHKSARINLKR